jgi:hypothetical protein
VTNPRFINADVERGCVELIASGRLSKYRFRGTAFALPLPASPESLDVIASWADRAI